MRLPPVRSSILFKVVGALVIALGVSTVTTAVIAARLTHAALDREAVQTAQSQLSVLQEAYSERERALVVNTRNLAETGLSKGLLEPQ
jgi:uncharacterized membrane protein (DUF106 family)